MCDGDFKEAHERHLVLPEDNPTDVGILVEYLYTRDFWAGNPQASVPKQESAVKLASIYLLADKYDLDGMKVLTTKKKIASYTNIAVVDDWLAVAEIICTATTESDYIYPRLLRLLVAYFMDSERSKGNGCMDALHKGIVKGGRLAVDIYRGSRIYSVLQGRKWLSALRITGTWLRDEEKNHRTNRRDCDFCSEGVSLDSDFPDKDDLKRRGVYPEESCDEDAFINLRSWNSEYKVDGLHNNDRVWY